MDTELLLLCEDELPNIDFEELESNDLLDIESTVYKGLHKVTV